jgi:hypothetical protein
MKSKKRIEKSIKSYDELIKEHEEKIEKFGDEKPWLKNYWENQIEEFEHQKEIEEKKLRK